MNPTQLCIPVRGFKRVCSATIHVPVRGHHVRVVGLQLPPPETGRLPELQSRFQLMYPFPYQGSSGYIFQDPRCFCWIDFFTQPYMGSGSLSIRRKREEFFVYHRSVNSACHLSPSEPTTVHPGHHVQSARFAFLLEVMNTPRAIEHFAYVNALDPASQ